jgi:hypothetical protein
MAGLTHSRPAAAILSAASARPLAVMALSWLFV